MIALSDASWASVRVPLSIRSKCWRKSSWFRSIILYILNNIVVRNLRIHVYIEFTITDFFRWTTFSFVCNIKLSNTGETISYSGFLLQLFGQGACSERKLSSVYVPLKFFLRNFEYHGRAYTMGNLHVQTDYNNLLNFAHSKLALPWLKNQ